MGLRVCAACLFVLCGTATASGTQKLIAVLELRNKLGGAAPSLDAAYLADVIRSSARDALPGAQLMTRDNVMVLLEGAGKQLEDCQGECEVDTGRKLGADLVVSGELLRFGDDFKVSLKLHDTHSARFLSGLQASGETAKALEADLRQKLPAFFAPLKSGTDSIQPKEEGAKDAGAAESAKPAPGLGLVVPEALPKRLELEADTEVLVAYDAALQRDAAGKSRPAEAAKAWEAVARLKGKNPYRAQARDRAKAWRAFAGKRVELDKQRMAETEKLSTLLQLESIAVHKRTALAVIALSQAYGGEAVEDAVLKALARGGGKRLNALDPLLGQACEARQAPACEAQAFLHREHLVPNADDGEAGLERACELQSVRGCLLLALWKGLPYLTAPGAEEAAKEACSGGAVVGCSPPSPEVLDPLCAAGDHRACVRLAGWFGGWSGSELPSVTPSDNEKARAYVAKAVALLEPRCRGGAVAECREALDRFNYGRHNEADHFSLPAAKKLVAALEAQCHKGNAVACFALSLEVDWVFAESKARSEQIFAATLRAGEPRCEAGDAWACWQLGWTFESVADPRSSKKALPYYEKACALATAAGLVEGQNTWGTNCFHLGEKRRLAEAEK